MELLELAIEPVQQGFFTGIPVLEMTSLAGMIEILTGVPQLLHVLSLHDLHHFEADVSQRLNLRIPQHRVGFELLFDSSGRQLLRVGAGAVVLVSRWSEGARD